MRSFEENLTLYARLAVRVGINLQPNQELVLTANTREMNLARLIVREAYEAGAKHVFVQWNDELCGLAKYELGSDSALDYAPAWYHEGVATALRNGAARLSVYSEDPALLKHIAPAKIAKQSSAIGKAAKPVGELVTDFAINWSLIGCAHPAWSKHVFPDCSEAEAVEKMWHAIFLTSRVLENDPVAAWSAHCDGLDKRKDYLNKLAFDALHFKGPGTDLEVGLVANHVWKGGWGMAKNGVKCSPNIPTEEVFTMPHKLKTNGHVRSTKALALRGQVIEGIEVEFKDGRAVAAKAAKGEETLLGLLDTDPGARHLGEVALVPASALVAKAGIQFFNTLYDENAASHIAFGRCYSENMSGFNDLSPAEQSAAGANESLVHEDWMIGSEQVDVDGILAGGERRPLMRSGEWVDAI